MIRKGLLFPLLIALWILPESFEKRRVQRCYVCRSRGDLGDCRDPFPHNETTVERERAIEAAPCASGWCAKIIEGKHDDYAIATERMCLQIPPQDQEQRCAETLYRNAKVFMCFCKGDLCNGARSVEYSMTTLLVSAIALFILERNRIR